MIPAAARPTPEWSITVTDLLFPPPQTPCGANKSQKTPDLKEQKEPIRTELSPVCDLCFLLMCIIVVTPPDEEGPPI